MVTKAKPAPAKPRSKRPAEEPEAEPSVAAPPAPAGLFPTDVPGTFRNKMGVLVDAKGIALSFKDVRKRDAERFSEALNGDDADTPAKLMKAAAFDPRLPLAMRLDYANKAAPYFDRKQPQALDGGLDPATGQARPLFDSTKLKGLDRAELLQLKALLAKGGATE